MSDQSRPDRDEFPVVWFVWFIASIVGLWFVIRNGDPRQIPEGWILYYLFFTAITFIAFECGWYCGGMFRQWWACYIFVFSAAASLPIVFWWLWWHENIILSPMLPPKLPSPQSEVVKINAVTISNLAATFFVVLIIPACCGVYFRRRKA